MTSRHTRRSLASAVLVGVVTAVGLAACGSGGSGGRDDRAAVPSSVATPNLAPASTVVPTTTVAAPDPGAPPPATAAPTTAAPSSIVVPTTLPLPVPIAPPVDDESSEPVVEIGRVAIPALGIDRTLYEGIRLPTFDLGPGHWPGTAEPGQRGNMVIGGHRTSGAADFRDLDRLQAGDQLVVTASDGTPYTYAVEAVRITSPFATQLIYQTQEKTATLFACHPPGSTDQRIVVDLQLVTT